MAPKTVLIPLAPGAEELEAVAVVNVLRRGGVTVTIAAVATDKLQVVCSRETTIVADCFLKDCKDIHYDCIALPGGLPGAEHLRDSEELKAMLTAAVEGGRLVAAICASPALVLSHHGLLKGTKATCYPAMKEKLAAGGATCEDGDVVIAGKFITSRGPGTAVQFGLNILAQLGLDAKKIGSDMLVDFLPAQ